MGRGRLVTASRILAGACMLLAAASLTAQDRPLFPGQNQPQAASSNNDALSLLLDQNTQLRIELQALRALAEEQGFELRTLQRDSLSRYTNMDQRLQALENSAAPPAADPGSISGEQNQPLGSSAPAVADSSPVPSSIPSAPLANTETATPETTVVTPIRSRTSTLQPAVLSEQQLYQMAYESAINSNLNDPLPSSTSI